MRPVAEAQAAGVSQQQAAQALGLSVRTLQRWPRAPEQPKRGGNPRPGNALLPAEQALGAETVAHRDLADLSCRALAFWVLDQHSRDLSPVRFWRDLKDRAASHARLRRVRAGRWGRNRIRRSPKSCSRGSRDHCRLQPLGTHFV